MPPRETAWSGLNRHDEAREECWLYCAKAYAESDAERALAAYHRATAIDPAKAHRVDPAWKLFQLLAERQDSAQ